ncbi:hypothetical protein ACH44C_00050 [Streptomyces purpureus]|uniref:hypothetical protein n=1 Tax=Streptomyces purpureus TaxID=1951 RepID=UPI0037B4D719
MATGPLARWRPVVREQLAVRERSGTPVVRERPGTPVVREHSGTQVVREQSDTPVLVRKAAGGPSGAPPRCPAPVGRAGVVWGGAGSGRGRGEWWIVSAAVRRAG